MTQRAGEDTTTSTNVDWNVSSYGPSAFLRRFDAFTSTVDDGISSASAEYNATAYEPGLPATYQAGLITLYSVTTAASVIGNLLVIGVLAVGRRSRTDLRAYLLSLAVADVMMATFCMPFTFTTTMLHRWIFGAAMCTIVVYMQLVSVTASVYTSMAIAVSRCLVVTRPLHRRRDGARRRTVIIVVVWAVAAALSSVQLVVTRTATFDVGPGLQVAVCEENWPSDTWRRAYTFFLLMTTYVVPLSTIAPAYMCVARRLWRRRAPGSSIRSRDLHQLQSTQRVIKMLTVMVTLFAVCWLPLHVFTVVVDFVPELRSEDNAKADGIVVAVYTSVHWLAMSNSFVNPIIYGFLNDNFRSDLRSLCARSWWFRRLCPGRLVVEDSIYRPWSVRQSMLAPGGAGVDAGAVCNDDKGAVTRLRASRKLPAGLDGDQAVTTAAVHGQRDGDISPSERLLNGHEPSHLQSTAPTTSY